MTWFRIPVVAQQVKSLTVSMRMQVQSLALLSGLRIQHCPKLQCRSQMWLESGVAAVVASVGNCSWLQKFLAQELLYATRVSRKKKKKKKKKDLFQLKEKKKKYIFILYTNVNISTNKFFSISNFCSLTGHVYKSNIDLQNIHNIM